MVKVLSLDNVKCIKVISNATKHLIIRIASNIMETKIKILRCNRQFQNCLEKKWKLFLVFKKEKNINLQTELIEKRNCASSIKRLNLFSWKTTQLSGWESKPFIKLSVFSMISYISNHLQQFVAT